MSGDWSSDVCSSDLGKSPPPLKFFSAVLHVKFRSAKTGIVKNGALDDGGIAFYHGYTKCESGDERYAAKKDATADTHAMAIVPIYPASLFVFMYV